METEDLNEKLTRSELRSERYRKGYETQQTELLNEREARLYALDQHAQAIAALEKERSEKLEAVQRHAEVEAELNRTRQEFHQQQ